MITDLVVLELGDRLMLLVPADRRDAIAERLDQSIFSEDVTIEDEAGLYDQIGVDGPRAAAAISRAVSTSGAVDSLPVYGSVPCESRGASAIVARTDWLGIPGYDIFIETPGAGALREALAQAGVPAASDDVAQVVRVESGRPLFGVDMDEHTIPLEAGIEDRAISFSKGCYVGQEVIIRVLHRGGGRIARRLVGLTLGDRSAGPPARDQALTAEGRDVGRLTSVVHSPALDRDIALGYVARELSEPGTALQLAGGGGAVPAGGAASFVVLLVIASATSSASGGTTLLKMADLSPVRVRAMFNETDIGNVHPGQKATVTVDAYPIGRSAARWRRSSRRRSCSRASRCSRCWSPSEPRRLLKPGMNGEVSCSSTGATKCWPCLNDAVRNDARGSRPRPRCSASTPTPSRRRSVSRWWRWAAALAAATARAARAARAGTAATAAPPMGAGRASRTAKSRSMCRRRQGDSAAGGRRERNEYPEVTDQDCARLRRRSPRTHRQAGARRHSAGRSGGGEADCQRMRAVSERSIQPSVSTRASRGPARSATRRAGRRRAAGRAGDARTRGSRRDSEQRRQPGDVRGSGAPARADAGGGGRGPVPAGEFSTTRTPRPRRARVRCADRTGFEPRVIRAASANSDYTEVVADSRKASRSSC